MPAQMNDRHLLSIQEEGHAGVHSPTTTSPESLKGVEEEQADAGRQNPGSVDSERCNEVKSKYAGLLAASILQEKDRIQLSMRDFTLPFAFLQGYLDIEAVACWDKIQNAILAGDDSSVPGLMNEFMEKASVCEIGQKRKFLAALERRRPRDLRVFLRYLTLGGTVDQQYPWDTSQWKGLLDLDQFEDWTRSIILPHNSKICKWLAFLLPRETIEIKVNGQQKTRLDPTKLRSLLAVVVGVSTNIFLGTPFVILASEVFSRWVNIIIVVVWVLVLLMFLVAWGVNSSNLFVFVMIYATLLANINLAGSK